jgi:GT2 family glycosyltransferase
MASARRAAGFTPQDGGGNAIATGVQERLRVAGKLFARGTRRLRLQGVTYGPFAPDAEGQPFPTPGRAAEDFARMRAAGINTFRTYHTPPDWLFELAAEHDLGVFVDVPWPKHLCFLDSREAQREARQRVRQAAEQGRRHPCVAAYSIGNEVPPTIVRWHGARRVERFLAELGDTVRQADPQGLVTYANYPPTEYLDLSFLDFATFNVYLHDRQAFRRYLFRLQNLVGDRPLVLGELGMDTFRHGEHGQAEFLAGHVEEALLMGLAGAYVFSWTDEWHTGGCPIEDWAFGITTAGRQPKPSYHALQQVWKTAPYRRLARAPRVSVVVCTYNGGRTLDQCLRSLLALDYPDYEVIVVDDGSQDDTGEILARFPAVHAVRQANAGLSAARNVGLWAASGAVVAYTDDDCFADPDWLTHLVYQLETSGADAVGGPNLSPEDGRLAACVAAAPGQPTHVLVSDQVAEHIPGCNMAFRRQALAAINGFDPQYRKAGDDVDLCWRLQQAGLWITFAPGAFVWHHRRQGPRAYLRQQAGYGEAEALLHFKHPDKFTDRGNGKWRGVLYGNSLCGLRLSEPIIYRGPFAAGLFQCVYQPAPAHWAMLPATLEWHLGVAALALAALFWPPALLVVLGLWALSLLVAALQAAQARLPPEYDGVDARCLVALLCYLQPLVRSWHRYRTRLSAYRATRAAPPDLPEPTARIPLTGTQTVAYWGENWRERTELLNQVVRYLNEHRWGKVVDSGWENWDLQIYCHAWTVVQVHTAEEDHGGGHRLMRVRYRLRPSGYTRTLLVIAALAGAGAGLMPSWVLGIESGFLVALCLAAWWRGTRRASQAIAVFDMVARRLNLIRCEPAPQAEAAQEQVAPDTVRMNDANSAADTLRLNGHAPANEAGALPLPETEGVG